MTSPLLRAKGLAMRVSGDGRVAKHEQRFTEKYNLGRREAALLCVLMLRGPQTVGEIGIVFDNENAPANPRVTIRGQRGRKARRGITRRRHHRNRRRHWQQRKLNDKRGSLIAPGARYAGELSARGCVA